MTAEERLELAIRTLTRIRDHRMECYNTSMRLGWFDQAGRNMDEVLIWDQALQMISNDETLMAVAKDYNVEVSE
jgi:hypothetical protein